VSSSSAKKNGSAKTARVTWSHGPGQEARRTAAAILEVLAGIRTPSEAAQALSVSVPRYYALEQRAVTSLVAGCEPHLRGPVKSPQQRIAELEREIRRLRQQCDRQRALARAVQRTVGLPVPASSVVAGKVDRPSPSASGKKRRTRRPTVRALKAAQALRDARVEEPTSEPKVAETVSATSSP
jgi:HAMP domain-containing protein